MRFGVVRWATHLFCSQIITSLRDSLSIALAESESQDDNRINLEKKNPISSRMIPALYTINSYVISAVEGDGYSTKDRR